MTAIPVAALAALGTFLAVERSQDPELVTYVDDQPPSTGSPRSPDLAQKAAALVEEYPSQFLGSYVDQAGRVVLRPSDERGQALADTIDADPDSWRVVTASVSLDEANALAGDLKALTPFLDSSVHTWGASPEYGGIFIELQGAPADDERAAIEDFADANALPVAVAVVPIVSNTLD
ncbi:MAG: hypothetical protein WKF50_01245 [Nocardioides sp.]